MTAFSAADVTRIARDWPGKSEPSEHPALWHMLDVAAVAHALLRQTPLHSPAVDQALAALSGLHDLGKISASFRARLREGKPQQRYHWEHSAYHLSHTGDPLAQSLGGSSSVRACLVEALAGHHGGPRTPPVGHYLPQQAKEISAPALRDAQTAIAVVLSCFPGASLEGITEADAKVLSWQLNGLTVQSDWIASNPKWFPPTSGDMPLTDYWTLAQTRADAAIADAGLSPAQIAQSPAANVLRFPPRPMQAAVLDASLPNGPMLALIEDSTGAGKTEAALMLAKRMMQAGQGTGIFFALPTMATANAMLSRVEAAAAALFDTAPSLALSHGRARLSEAFRTIQARSPAHPEQAPHCGNWLADDRRRVLLADLGVGTLDQALLGVLPTRFNGLRLRALSQRILIVDEAHDYDPYMQAELERLLQMQARLGGCAIVMTATLPSPKKAGFERAFQLGRKDRPPARRLPPLQPEAEAPYPALTLLGAQREVRAVPAAGQRHVSVSRLCHAQGALEMIRDAQAKGAASIWIRNAVDDAIAAVESLRDMGIAADLLHARFAVCDRLAKEQALLARFGPDAPRDARRGRVLVATQVAEQSLDVDFDVMISDLAPIGAMLQRAGRLWRHMGPRPQESRPVAGPHLYVLAPDPAEVQNDRWLQTVLDRGAFTYDVSTCWRSAKALFDAGAIAAPEGLRALIEAVEGANPLPLPEALQAAQFKHEGQEIIERGMARNVLIKAHEAFDQDAMAKVWDEERYPTRLGVPQVTLALARRTEVGLEPLAEGAAGAPDLWAMSEVQISAKRFESIDLPQESADIAAIKAQWSKARAAHSWIAVLGEGGKIAEGLRYDGRLGVVFTT